MIKKLKHTASDPSYPDLQPVKDFVPQWYRDATKHLGGKIQIHPVTSLTIKACVPFMDTMLTGYIIPLPRDIIVSLHNTGDIYFSWNSPDRSIEGVEIRPREHMQDMPVPPGYAYMYPAWSTETMLELPKGYSALITHPLNRFDLPFMTTSGIIDDFSMFKGKIPFFIKQGFEGVIERGTPIAQVIPFKREDWESVKDPTLKERATAQEKISFTYVQNWYRKNVWKKKKFN